MFRFPVLCGLVLSAALALAATASAQVLHPALAGLPAAQLAKADRAVLLLAAKGPQRLVVSLDQGDIIAREVRRHGDLDAQIGAGSFNEMSTLQQHQGIVVDAGRDIAARLSQVLTTGSFGGNRLVKAYDHFATAVVDIADAPTLAKMLAHEKVISVGIELKGQLVGSHNLSLIGQPAAVTSGRVGANTRVAMLDSGFDFHQPEFATDNRYPACKFDYETGNVASNVGGTRCRLSNAMNFADAGQLWCEGGPECSLGTAYHGESVAGIILSVAPSTKIAALQIFDLNGNGTSTYAMNALNWVIGNANVNPKIVAVNISVRYADPSGTCSGNIFGNAISRLNALGVAVIVASGNEASTQGVDLPACDPGAVAVGAVYDTADPRPQSFTACSEGSGQVDHVPCFSNTSSKIALLAPGVGITINSTSVTGTSQAAPHVAGAIAVLRGTNAFTADNGAASVGKLTQTGVSVTDPRNQISRPRIQLDAALGLTVGSVAVAPDTASITAGSSAALAATVKDALGDAKQVTVTWSSSNPSIATVDGNGNVVGVGPGSATISASAGGKSGSATVTVTSGRSHPPPPPNCQQNPALCA